MVVDYNNLKKYRSNSIYSAKSYIRVDIPSTILKVIVAIVYNTIYTMSTIYYDIHHILRLLKEREVLYMIYVEILEQENRQNYDDFRDSVQERINTVTKYNPKNIISIQWLKDNESY